MPNRTEGSADMSLRIRNLVFVSYDSVRADVAYGGDFPGVERLRRHGTTFLNCVASAPLTPVSHATILTGLQPYHHGIRHLFKEPLRDDCTTIASLLHAAGLSTSAVVSCPGLHRWYGLCRGYTQYDDEIPSLPDGTDALLTVDVKLRGQALKRAPLVVERSQRLLAAEPDRPFFHFIHFFDAHWPYDPPERTLRTPVKNLYEAEIAYLDHHFSRWLDWMESTGRLEDTLVVLFGDHGEDLSGWYENDKGGDERNHPEEMGHGCLLYDQTIMVPLIFSHPDLPARSVVSQVRLVDVMPTCLELMNQSLPVRLDGVSLASAVLDTGPATDLPAYCETAYPREQVEATGGQFEWTRNKKAIRLGNQSKIIFHLDSDIVEVYDLLNDPREERNLLHGRTG